MKIADVARLLEGRPYPTGYRVNFEVRENGMLRGDFFPDRDEAPIPTFEVACRLAEAFAEQAPAKYVNIRITNTAFEPVGEVRWREYPPREPRRV